MFFVLTLEILKVRWRKVIGKNPSEWKGCYKKQFRAPTLSEPFHPFWKALLLGLGTVFLLVNSNTHVENDRDGLWSGIEGRQDKHIWGKLVRNKAGGNGTMIQMRVLESQAWSEDNLAEWVSVNHIYVLGWWTGESIWADEGGVTGGVARLRWKSSL